jgi:plastocyanin
MARLALSAAGVALVAAVTPAFAAQDHTITASNFQYTNGTITIATGDRVIFANSGGTHNFAFDPGPDYPEDPLPANDAAWNPPPSRTFDTPGTYPFHCEQHPTQMTGTITVTGAPPTPTPSPAPSPAPQPSPSPSPSPEPGGSGGTTPAGGLPVVVRSLTLAPGRFCARRGPKCRRPGVRLRIDLAAPARVTGVLKRRGKRFGRVDFGKVAAGPRTLRFRRTASGKRLTAGRYTLAVSVDGVTAKTLRFRVR